MLAPRTIGLIICWVLIVVAELNVLTVTRAEGLAPWAPFSGTQKSLWRRLPPSQMKPSSLWQVELQPSPLTVLLSSHCRIIRLPSPQDSSHWRVLLFQ